MSYDRFKELYTVLVLHRPGAAAVAPACSGATLEAFAAYGQGDPSLIDALAPHFSGRDTVWGYGVS